ncbi:MAG TPA: glycosyltransferase [Candidatus Paceibacterota bacterium]
MRILLSNKFYYSRGGDCIYAIELEKLLKTKGHCVAFFSMQHSENIVSEYNRFFPNEVIFSLSNIKRMKESLLRPFGTQEVIRKFNALLDDFKPDVVHLNNVHTQLSPIVAEIAHKRGIHVVWTLHDYKLLCPRYDCLRNGIRSCELCFTDKTQVLKNKCMKNSIVASVIAYREAVKWNKEKLQNYTDCFICPSQFMKEKMIQGGFEPIKLHTLCNFIDEEKTRRNNYEKEDYYCFIGRLSLEKGVKTLIEAASQLPYRLKIIGNGPLMYEMQKQATNKNIEFVGYKKWHEIKEIVGKARFSVIPSECYENNPLSVIEAKCLGTPILGARTGGIPELIEEGKSGLLFESKNAEDLKVKIVEMFQLKFNYKELAEYSQKRYSSEKYYKNIMSLYQNKKKINIE